MTVDPNLAPIPVWEWIFGALWVIVVALVGVVWSRLTEDRKKTEGAIANMATKTELQDAVPDVRDFVLRTEYERNRQEVREDMREIHKKLDRVIIDVHNGQTAILSELASIKNDR